MFIVNGMRWDLQFVSPNSSMLKRSDGSITLGVTDNSLKTIFINKNLYGEKLKKVVCHELTHVFAFEYNYSVDLKTEEIIADFMSLFGRDIIYLADDIMNNLIRRIA